ncbi:hypothetical protein [Amycolatopsis xylanica]|uniref:hypothetical protein n=1 Tax=Amycolatopsis xylanica TaxID=589385 RepID=UPI00115FDDC4|nr:hypothetical protein [Amycolatopsis xylanica]
MLRFRERAQVTRPSAGMSPAWLTSPAGAVVTVGARSRQETFLRNAHPSSPYLGKASARNEIRAAGEATGTGGDFARAAEVTAR